MLNTSIREQSAAPLWSRRDYERQDLLNEILGDSLPAIWQVGDEIEFEDGGGWRWPITILELDGEGNALCLWWDGLPHLVRVAAAQLNGLRIMNRKHHGPEQVLEWRRLCGLEEWA